MHWLHREGQCHLHWQKQRGTILDKFQSLSLKMLGTTDLPWIKIDSISSLGQSNQNDLGLNPTILMDKCRWLKVSWVTLVPHQVYLLPCKLTALSFLQGTSSCSECNGNHWHGHADRNWCKSLVHHLAPSLGGNNLKHLQKRRETYRRWVCADMDREVEQNTSRSSNAHLVRKPVWEQKESPLNIKCWTKPLKMSPFWITRSTVRNMKTALFMQCSFLHH